MRALALIPLMVVALAAPAAIVDRSAVSVGGRVITASEIELRIRLTAFQNGEPANLSLAARRSAAQQLIDQRLVEREMDLGHYPRLDDESRDQLLSAWEADRAALETRLAGYGLTADDLEADLARQSDLLTFLSLRFRQTESVTRQQADAELDAWLRDQRKRVRILYLDKDLAP
jgi:hypothetical protein